MTSENLNINTFSVTFVDMTENIVQLGNFHLVL